MRHPRFRSSGRIPGLFLLALFSWLVLSCGGGNPPPEGSSKTTAPPRAGGTIAVGSIVDVDSWNEYLSRQSFANNLHRRIFLRLAQEMGDCRDHPPSFEPLLAESWTSAPDGTTITFKLRDATWSDGRTVTASDVVFTWKAQTSPEVGWINSETKARVRSVEAADDRTVVFHFDRKYPEQLADAVEGGIVPEHVFGTVPFSKWHGHDWSAVKVGSGPFLLERYAAGEEIVLVRNPRYFREGFPRLDRVVVRIVPDATSLLTQLLSRGIDYMEGVAPREAERTRAGSGVRLIAYDFPMFDYVGWNASKPPFDDPAVRRALTLAIDRKAIVEELLYGFGRISSGPVLSFWWGASRDLQPWPSDPGEALRILRSRGYLPRAGDGVLVRDGRPLEFEIMTNAGNRLRESVLVKIQDQLSKIGVRARPVPLQMQTLAHRCNAGSFDAFLGGWKFTGKLDLKPIFGSSHVPPAGSNVVRYKSAEVDRILEALARETEWEAMKPGLHALQRAIHEDQPYTFLYETQRLVAVGPRVEGAEIDIPTDPMARLEQFWVSR